MSKFTITCTDFRPLHRNMLLGFAQVSVSELKLTIRDIASHQQGEARWAQVPAKPQIKDGALLKDATGKVQYVHIMDFETRAVRDAFSRAVVDAVLQRVPQAFDEDLSNIDE